ncbi:MAG: hypothetical protein H6626_01850 [Pseudobdellovibrionaceae bacterium]|nr:hypothetical protein [Bdellovibrionales bacterium]USN47858.1 MAG: hypothetical protein H6626_01850 [Pseudobdellovibrionaceae bacterium]
MKLLSGGKLITCVLPVGSAPNVMQKLAEKQITRINFAHARGTDIAGHTGARFLPAEEEKEILTIVATDKNEADNIFAYLYEEVIDHPGGGFMYMTALTGATAYALPELVADAGGGAASVPSEPLPSPEVQA